MSTSTHAKSPPECMRYHRLHIPLPEEGAFSSLGHKLVAYDPDDFWSEESIVYEHSTSNIWYLEDALLLFYATPDEPIVLDCAGKRISTTPEDPNWRDASGNILTFLDLAVLLHTAERVRLVIARDNDK